MKTLVVLIFALLVSGFCEISDVQSQNSDIAAFHYLAQSNPAPDQANQLKTRPAAKKPEMTKESPPWNDFLQAAADGNDAALMRFLKEGAKPDDKSANGWTPLMWAAEAGHAKTVKILLEHGADVNAVGNNSRSALMLAAYRRQDEVVSILLDNGASPDAADEKGLTALMFACLANDEKTAASLITKGADINARDEEGFTPLMKVNDAGMADLLVKHGADVNAKSDNGMTALMTAARNKYTSVVKALLKYGADVQAEDNNGETALYWSYSIDQGGGIMEVHEVLEIFGRDTDPCKLCQACILGREDLVRKLLQKGVNPNIPCDLEYKAYPLERAYNEGHVGIVKLLLDKGAQVLTREDHVDALYMAALNGDFEEVKLLIERGAVSKKPWPDHYGAVCGQCDSKIFGLLLPHIERNHKGCIESAARSGCSENVKILLDSDFAVGPESIYLAATKGNAPTLELLLARAKEKGMPTREFGRALYAAARGKKSESVAALLDYGADVNQKDPDENDRTPLMTACRQHGLEAAKVLLEKGADVNAKDRDGATAMTRYAENADIVKLLVAHGATDRPRETAEQGKWEKFNTATLAAAVNAGDVKAVKQFLRKGADLNRVSHGDSLLHAAAEKAPGSIVKLLIDHGADLEAGLAGGGDTPLLVAVEKGNLEAAQVLLEHGANIKAYVEPQGDSIDTPTAMDLVGKNDKMRQLLLRFGAEYSELMDPADFERDQAEVQPDPPKSRPAPKKPEMKKESPPWTEFMQAAADGNDAAIIWLLKEGAKPDGKSANGWTPLMWAAEAGHTGAVKVLLSHGADVNAAGPKGRTALMLAAYREQHEVVSMLLDNGANPNAADAIGMTALMFACLAGDEKSATALIAKGADVNSRDKFGLTPLMQVTNAGTANLLLKHGADINAKSNDGMTPLMTATSVHNEDVIKTLLKNNADTKAEDKSGKTARDWSYSSDVKTDAKAIIEIFSQDTESCELARAFIWGDKDRVEKLLKKGTDPNGLCGPYDLAQTPLKRASEASYVRIIELLLEKGAVIGADHDAALYAAALNGQSEAVKLLLDRGALSKKPWPDYYSGNVCQECNPKIIQLLIPYMTRISKECLESASRHDCSESVKLLLDLDVAVDGDMIYYAALEGNSKTLELLLAKAKEKGMSPREFGRALHTAAANKKSKSIALLLEYGADINQKDPGRDDRTPLMDACRTGSFEAARLLIKNGADVNAKDKDGNTAMTFCAADREDIVKLLKANGAVDKPPKPQKVEIKTLADAVEAGDGKAVEMFLRKGEDPNGVSHGDSLLRIAAKKAPGSVVKLLIDYGADLEARDDEITPLPAAVKAGNLGAALVLLEYGVNPNAYVQDDGVGADTTALDIASREKNDKMRRLLLRFGAEYSELIDRENFD